MATKNLARTVLEAGRAGRSKIAKRELRRRQRHQTRKFCYDALTYEDPDDLGVAPLDIRKGWEFQQDDNLGALFRWVDSHVGQPWNEVYAKLTPFRRGGIAISHVADVHILGGINYNNQPDRYRYYRWVVVDGILQRQEQKSYRHRGWRAELLRDRKLKDLCGLRRVIVQGEKLYWSNPTVVNIPDYGAVAWSHRQGKELTDAEATIFRAASERARHDACGDLPTWSGYHYTFRFGA